MFSQCQFQPAWWLKNPHLQTITAKWFKRHQLVATQTEMLELPDGDFIDIDWTELPESTNNKPIVVILHGLEGSKNSHYAKGMLAAVKKQGWIGLLMHFRGCSGRPNRQLASYHSGDIRDISYLTSIIIKRYPNRSLALVGYSLGGNVAVKYLAKNTDHPYKASAVICAPLHLSSCSDRINNGFSKVYQNYLMKMLKQQALEKIQANKLTHISRQKLHQLTTIRDFDHHITAPINSFTSAEDYYQQASGREDLATIASNCLVIHAKDDPFLSHENIIAINQLPANIHFELSDYGGHVGFIESRGFFKPSFWLEQRIPDYLRCYL